MEFNFDQSIRILEKTPAIIRLQLEGLADEWVRNDYGKETWSVHQIIGHLIWGEKTDWVPRIKHIFEFGESKTFEPFDRSGHAELCEKSTLAELIDLFEQERSHNVTELENLRLGETDLERTGIHPAFGQVTIRQLISTWTVHEFNHLAQINKAMAAQYREEVGPWQAYLSILSPPNPR